MLPAAMRMRVKDDFTTTVRRGRRCGQPRLVVHLLLAEPVVEQASDQPLCAPPDTSEGYPQQLSATVDEGSAVDIGRTVPGAGAVRVGFVVSRQVGSSVVRNRVERRLRHACRDLATGLPDGTRLVVRATPASSSASFADLRDDLDRALARCLSGGRRPRGRP